MLKNESPQEFDDQYDKLIGRVSFWTSFVLATLSAVWYYQSNPPETDEVKRMRMFFKENSIEVSEFIKLPPKKMKEAAKNKTHPFFKSYIKSSEVEKNKINALIHVSIDYTPNQYWFNIIFLWVIFFTTFWFLGLMLQGVINLVRNDSVKKK